VSNNDGGESIEEYFYDGSGNVIQVKRQSVTYTFRYDNKTSPIRHCKTAQWVLWLSSWNILDDVSVGLHNNITESDRGTKTNYTYEYDKSGYPSESTAKTGDEEWNTIFLYYPTQ
jgi:YD repeat-containing protein